MKTKHFVTVLLVVALALCASAGLAQQKDPRVSQPAKPIQPPAAGESSSRTAAEAPADAPAAPAPQSNQPPLTSSEPWSLGFLGEGHSYLLPSFSVRMNADTNPSLNRRSGSSSISALTQLTGRLQFQHIWAKSQLAGDYAAIGELYSAKSNLDSVAHAFGVNYRLQKQRWTYVLADRAAYGRQSRGPMAGMGSGMFGSGNFVPGGLNVLNDPTQSVLTTRAPRIMNNILGEVQYTAGRRSTMTFSGSFGLLHFLESGFIDSKSGNFSAGYNYSISERDTLAVSYSSGLVRFDNGSAGVDSHGVLFSYGRTMSGRMSLRAGAGTQWASFVDPIRGPQRKLSWTAQSSLQYRTEKSSYNLSYTRGVSAGSGVYAGAQTNNVAFGFGRQISRMWSADFGGGYTRNERLRVGSTPADPINSVVGSFSLSRPVGRYSRLALRYDLQRQLGGINTIGFRHVFGVSFDFKFRALEIE